MSDIVIFHLKKLWPFDPKQKPDSEQLCARCGHAFYPSHTYRGSPSSCGYPRCRCQEFMVNLYEEIKCRRKTSEWRDDSEYWCRILTREPMSSFDFWSGDVLDLSAYCEPECAWFVVGYPKRNLPRLEAAITELFLHRSSHQFEICFVNPIEKTF